MTLPEAIYNSVGALCALGGLALVVFLFCVLITEKWPWEE